MPRLFLLYGMNGTKKEKNKDRDMKQTIVVMGVVIRNGKLLMTQRFEEECPEAHLKWELPGGKIDFGEDPKETIVREIFEETGVKVETLDLIPLVRTCIWNYTDGSSQHTILLAFNCGFLSEEIQKEKDHHVKDFKWVSLLETEKLETLPYDLDFVKEVVKRESI